MAALAERGLNTDNVPIAPVVVEVPSVEQEPSTANSSC